MSWGLMGLTNELNANRVIVEDIKEPSVLSQWNKVHPDRRLAPGDQVVEVNGKVDAQDIMQVFKYAQVVHISVRPVITSEALEPWLEAADNFELNSDFDISSNLEEGQMGLAKLMTLMKNESVDKSTIQAIGDKILLSRLLDNLKVPQMPLLFSTRCKADPCKVQELVDDLVQSEEGGDKGLSASPRRLGLLRLPRGPATRS